MSPLPGFTPFPPERARRYRELGYWRSESHGALLRASATTWPDRLAVIGGADRWTYAELDARVDATATGLVDNGVRARDRVVVALPNTAEFVEVVFALFRSGALPVFALPAHRETELTHFAALGEAVAVVVDGTDPAAVDRAVAVADRVPSVRRIVLTGATVGSSDPRVTGLADLRAAPPRRLPEPDADEVAFLQLSGGSTGIPKLIPRTHDDYLYSVRESARICGLGPDTVQLVVLPVAHNFPMSSPGILGALHAGGTVVLAPDPSPTTCFPLIEAERVTDVALVPPLALVWTAAAASGTRDLSSLRLVQVGGAKCTPELAARIPQTLGAPLQQVFGMAEGLVNYTRLDDPDDVVRLTQGRPISPDDEVRVVDDEDRDVPDGAEGHLLTRGPYTICGYYRADEHNARVFTPDGFYRTGDRVRRLADGNLVVEGRAKDQINRGGDKIAAEEIEDHLIAHPRVHDAAVVAVHDAFLGERSCAVVVLRGTEDPAPSAADLRAFVRGRGVADFKVPDRVEFVDALPATGVGKTHRSDLRAAVAGWFRAPAVDHAEVI
ncbi:AMP-binding protein [Actinomycetospora endophytica]|uniref:AMP-binding protein n=1 Tax=Actinomycetospora endophytica TaxID=2291215 RepID=A0ABS8PKV0_9PSEU|nr:AMP-binding protein [Actinomycetospora endophytica]MCD2197604.1 AMP-binding protein [Actinomycetospora endophytica]